MIKLQFYSHNFLSSYQATSDDFQASCLQSFSEVNFVKKQQISIFPKMSHYFF